MLILKEDLIEMSMCVEGTPVEHYSELGLYVKREDLCCPGGPNFSKTRGVFAHIEKRPERVIGVLDTAHSQGGWAVARACKELNKHCVLFYPVRKNEWNAPLKEQQQAALDLDAGLVQLQAGRSAVLYHRAKKELARETDGEAYMVPNALKLSEMVTETVAEVRRTKIPKKVETVLVPASSGTIAAGVWRGLWESGWEGRLIVHLGYSRPEAAVRKYITQMAFGERPPLDGEVQLELVDENYAYADVAKPGTDAPFPCNEYYDLKTFRWWLTTWTQHREALLWNIG